MPASARLCPFTVWRLLFLACCVIASSGGLLGGRALYEIREIKPTVFVWLPDDVSDQQTDPQFRRTANAGFVITPKGVVVVDTANSPFHAREILYEIRQRTEAPVAYVINTAFDGDHTLGNEVFLGQQATILSSVEVNEEIRWYHEELARRQGEEDGWRLRARLRGFHPTPPNQVFEKEMTLRLDDEEVRLINFSSEVAAGAVAVQVPRAKVLFLGGLFQNGYVPRIGWRNVRGWVELLKHMETWDVDFYVPGHGLPAGKQGVAEFRQLLEWLTGEIRNRIREGKSLAQIKRELIPFQGRSWRAPENSAATVEAIFQQVVEENASVVPDKDSPKPPALPQR